MLKRIYIFVLFLTLVFYIYGALVQSDQELFLSAYNDIIKDSYTVPLPSELEQTCKSIIKSNVQTYVNYTTVELIGNFTATQAQKICGTNSLCRVAENSTLTMNDNLNLAALSVEGKVVWNDKTQTSPVQWLCAGFVVMEKTASFEMSLTECSHTGYIYIKDNGAYHPVLRTRVFGGVGSSGSGPSIDIFGRPFSRTWSLIASPVAINSTNITLFHNPYDMGWQVGDRIIIAATQPLSQGTSQAFNISWLSPNSNQIVLSAGANQVFNAQFLYPNNAGVALMAAEVINLSRNIIITGDNFRNVNCDPGIVPVNGISTLGCSCNPSINRTVCTIGLHTMLDGGGVMRMQYARFEKCGQRGVKGKYCMHFHFVDECPNCLFQGNAVEFGMQRGIVVHETHLSTVQDNVLNDVRGAGIFIEDGNEMYNKIKYNVVVCPWVLISSTKYGCTVPGTDNGQADGSDNQAGFWAINPINDLVGNRAVNSFNGMFYDLGDDQGGIGEAQGHVNTLYSPMGRLDGNTFHGHGRFGTYVLSYFPKRYCLPNLTANGWLTNKTLCTGFTSVGLDNGLGFSASRSVDYQSAFIGGYTVGDFQYNRHVSINNLNNIYWKETKNFADGCSGHIVNGYYSGGNMALPDMAAFIIENTIFSGSTTFEANHHCNVGVTGFLCMPTYVLSNVSWITVTSTNWVIFHQNANNYGGIFTLAPPEQNNPQGLGFFPPNYNSLCSFFWSYLVAFGPDVCAYADTINDAWPGVPANELASFYAQGILCKLPLRSLRVYSYGLTLETGYNLTLSIYSGNKMLTNFSIPYHQIGSDGSTTPAKQGWAFPVVVNANYEYVLGREGGDGKVPSDFIIEFSDPVFGNRWSPDTIILTVRGQNCTKKTISSQHDRRWVWSGSPDYLESEAWGHGACSSYPNMPAITCPSAIPPLSPTSCQLECSTECNNGYCDCGSKKCVCNPGFVGSSCSIDLCAAARCGPHGVCSATYLGGNLTVTEKACICDTGWSGPTCEENPCVGITCSGNGQCRTIGDTDWRCTCNPGYSGRLCENTCINFGCGSETYPFDCSPVDSNPESRYCLHGGGCLYTPVGSKHSSSYCCYQNCDNCSIVTCPPASSDCYLAGSCQTSGACSAETERPDGSPCNSVPYGVCKRGVCVSTSSTPASTGACTYSDSQGGGEGGGSDSNTSSSTLSTGVTAAISVICVLACACFVGIGIYYFRRHRKYAISTNGKMEEVVKDEEEKEKFFEAIPTSRPTDTGRTSINEDHEAKEERTVSISDNPFLKRDKPKVGNRLKHLSKHRETISASFNKVTDADRDSFVASENYSSYTPEDAVPSGRGSLDKKQYYSNTNQGQISPRDSPNNRTPVWAAPNSLRNSPRTGGTGAVVNLRSGLLEGPPSRPPPLPSVLPSSSSSSSVPSDSIRAATVPAKPTKPPRPSPSNMPQSLASSPPPPLPPKPKSKVSNASPPSSLPVSKKPSVPKHTEGNNDNDDIW